MKRNKFIILFSYFLFLVMVGVVFADLGSAFSFSDLPFVLVFSVFFVFMIIQRGTSKIVFVSASYFLITMGLSYVRTGSSVITERLGEWFYLFFLVGILQYTKEAFKAHK
ncbi:hypothetical protein KJ618_02385 [Patescibacteria group bacterium]|nr:hypothetical protein [Patescibacteria group bacterium]